MEQTLTYWDAVTQQALSQGLSEEKLVKLRSAQILRSLAGKSDFTRAAVDVAKNISALRSFVAEHRRDYVQPGRLEDSERDRIEEQVGMFVRSCTENIRKLEATIERTPALSPQSKAHRHGAALILSERLQSVSAVFDVMRSQRYQQLLAQRQKQHRRQREIQEAKARVAAAPQASLRGEPGNHSVGPGGDDPQLQRQMQAENRALQEELQDLGRQVRQTEASMQELAVLNQMFSTQVLHQSEQTRQLYEQAVQASELVSKGNVQLEKAIRLNSSTRKLLFVFFMIASLLLLLFDWWSS